MGTGTADTLPECVIRKILCYLSYGEATRMRILSKTWLQAWLTLPNLAFGVSSGESITIVDEVTKRYRDGNIPIDRFELHNFTEPDGLFPLIDKWLGIALQNGVKYLVYRDVRYSSSYPFPIFIFLAAESLRELVLTGCDLMHISLSTSRLVNCHSLRKLSLSCVHLDENMLQTLLTSCPLIDTLIIEHCIGLNKIELRNLHKITTLTINIHRRVKIQAPTLEHLSYSSYSLEELDIVEYHNLKSLEISCMQISKGFLEHLISRPHFLESLKLVKITSGSFDICRSQSLRVLKIQNCEIIGTIDAPNLVLFEYKGRHVIPQLKFARESSHLKHSQIILDSLYNLDATWFCKLRKFLSNSTSWSQVTLYFLKCNEINMKYLQLHHRIATPQVDILDVKFLMPTGECPTFVDALLWSCHPRRLNLHSTSEMFTCFINRLMYMKNLSHSPSHESEPWQSQLKEAKVYKFDQESQSWHPVEHKRGELSIRTTSKRERYFFLLDW